MVSVRGREEIVRPTQIILWVSVADPRQPELDPATPLFPVILDTGLSHNFAIQEEHLERWAGISPRWLKRLRQITIRGDVVPLHDASVWLHPNQPGRRDPDFRRRPFRLAIESGIAIYPRGMPAAPRLPLLGLRGLEGAGLRLAIDCENRRVGLRSRRRWFLVGG